MLLFVSCLGLDSLQDLRLNNNPLTMFDVNGFLPSLLFLDVSETFISEFDFIIKLESLNKMKVQNVSEANKQLMQRGRNIEIFSDYNKGFIQTEYYTSISYIQQPNSNFNLKLYFFFTLFIFMCVFSYFIYLHVTQCIIKRQSKFIHSLVV